MQATQPIDAFVINHSRFSAFIISYMIVATVGPMLLALHSSSSTFGLSLLAVLLVAISVFEKQARRPFSKRAEVTVSEQAVEINLYNIKTGDPESNTQYNYSDIEWFTTAKAAKNDFTSFKFFLRDGSIASYHFYGQKTDYKNSINELLFAQIKIYNAKNPDSKIQIHTSYFTTHRGRVVTLITGMLFTAVIVMEAFLKPQVIPVTSIPVVIFFFGVVLGSIIDYRSQKKKLEA